MLGAGVVLAVAALVACWYLRRSDELAARRLVWVVATVLLGWVLVRWLQPDTGSVAPRYALSAASIVLLFAPALATARALVARLPARRAGIVATGLLVVLAIAVTPQVSARTTTAPNQSVYGAGDDLADQVAEVVEPSSALVLRPLSGFDVRDVAITTAVVLQDDGLDVAVAPEDGLVPYFGVADDGSSRSGAPELLVVDGRAPDPPTPTARLVAEWNPGASIAAEMERTSERVSEIVDEHGGVSLVDSPDAVERVLTGWDEVRSDWADETSRLRDTPPELLMALYADGLVSSPALPEHVAAVLDEHRAAHRIRVFIDD